MSLGQVTSIYLDVAPGVMYAAQGPEDRAGHAGAGPQYRERTSAFAICQPGALGHLLVVRHVGRGGACLERSKEGGVLFDFHGSREQEKQRPP